MSLCLKGVKGVSTHFQIFSKGVSTHSQIFSKGVYTHSKIFSKSTNHVKHNIFGSSNQVATLTPNLTKQVG